VPSAAVDNSQCQELPLYTTGSAVKLQGNIEAEQAEIRKREKEERRKQQDEERKQAEEQAAAAAAAAQVNNFFPQRHVVMPRLQLPFSWLSQLNDQDAAVAQGPEEWC